MKKILLFLCALVCSAAMSATDVYLVPNSNWLGENARFAVYCFQGETNQWVDMEAVDGAENTFKATVDETKFQNLIFCRMNPATTENNWDNKWSQSVDLTVPTDNKVVYHVKDATWDKGGGEWTALGEDPGPIETVYVVTGGDVNIFGTEWDVNSACVLEKQTDGSYAWTKTDVTLAAGSVAYKMLEKGTWSGWQLPAQGNASFTIDKSGTYDLTFTLSADLSKQNVVTTLKEEVEVLPVVRLMGSLTNWGEGLVLTPSDDKLTASGVVSLEAKEYEMKIRVDGGWYGNAGTMDRGNCTGWVFDTTVESNAKITADVAGNYTFTWTYANNSLSVTYPMAGPTSISSTEAEVVTTKVIRDGQVLIIRDGVVYNMMGQAIR